MFKLVVDIANIWNFVHISQIGKWKIKTTGKVKKLNFFVGIVVIFACQCGMQIYGCFEGGIKGQCVQISSRFFLFIFVSLFFLKIFRRHICMPTWNANRWMF